MSKKMQTGEQGKREMYYGNIPSEVVKELTPEIRRQYFLWDEMFKRQIELYPARLFPVVKEIFGKEYPDGTEVTMRSTEYVVDKVYGQGEKRIESIRSDLLVQIGSRDLYHMECQMKCDGHMAVRMLEYDMNIALREADVDRDGSKVRFPQSAILYLDSGENTPDVETCTIVFQDGTEYEYRIPVLKVQRYTPEMAGEKGLCLLLPFFPIRFRRRFEAVMKKAKDPVRAAQARKEMEALKKDLTKFIGKCIIIIKREEENGTLSGRAGADIVELMGKACDHLYGKEPELLKVVHEVMEPAIKLLSERMDEKIAEYQRALKLLSEEKYEKIEELAAQKKEFELYSEKMDEKIAEQEKEFKLYSEQLICNCIRQYKEEGRTKEQVESVLQKIFSIALVDAKEKIERYW